MSNLKTFWLVPLCLLLNSFYLTAEMARPLEENNPVISELVYSIRKPQTDLIHFREAIMKIGEYMGIEIARSLPTKEVSVFTIMNETAHHRIMDAELVIIPVMRAGLPLYLGLSQTFPTAHSGFFGAMRDEETLLPYIDYTAFPSMDGKTVILADTMIATGGSVIESIKHIKKYNPRKIILAGVIAAQRGIQNILEYDPDIEIFVASVDNILNERGYIVPGLGDAGDRCYGEKLPR